jgi:hypothetical protein
MMRDELSDYGLTEKKYKLYIIIQAKSSHEPTQP